MASRILILYYSSYGHVEQMASAVAAGARSVDGTEVTVKRVPELVPKSVARAAGMRLDQPVPLATVDELPGYDAIIFGTPTRFGNMAAQMRNFLDQTGSLWQKGELVGKVGGVFCATATQHGGQESTLLSFHVTLLHHGMIVVGIPSTCHELFETGEASGGTPYGATTLSAPDGSRLPTANELAIAHFQGQHVATVTCHLVTGRGRTS